MRTVSIEIDYFLNSYYHTKFQDSTLNGASVATSSEVPPATMLILLMVEN
jgi:hypothetical protein